MQSFHVSLFPPEEFLKLNKFPATLCTKAQASRAVLFILYTSVGN